MQDIDGEARINSLVMFFYEVLHIDAPMLTNQLELTSTLPMLYVVWKTCYEQRMIGTDAELGKFMLSAQLDDFIKNFTMVYSL